MKKRILSLILALSMVLSVLPLGAFAEGSSGDLIIGSDGYPVGSNGGKDSCSGNDWEYSNGALYLNLGAFNLSTTEPVKCEIHSFATITGGTFNGKVYNFGTISGGTFQQDVENHGTIKNGTFNGDVTNDTTGKISGGTFASDKKVENKGTIEKGTFEGKVTNSGTIERGTFTGTVINSGTIENGTFASSVTNYGNIDSKGTFNGTVGNGPGGTISNGTFNGTVTNNVGTISGGTFKETVINSNGEITGGTFAGSVTNMYVIYGGVFNGKTGLDRVTGVHSITWDAASPDAKIEKVNGVSANWAPYVVVTKSTPTTAKEVTITADTEIFSLNGKPIGAGNCNSSYGVDKKTVKFTMPNEDVVLSTGDLVMEGGYPIGTSGKGWRYISGTLYLDEGTYNFSSTHPQNTGAGTRPVPAVRCMIEIRSGVEITGGSFGNSVTNYGTISSGTFQTMGGGVINEGTIKNGTFTDSVTNNKTISGGTFQNGCSVTNGGTISDGTFQNRCIVTNKSIISGGTFQNGCSVTNNKTISGGTFQNGCSVTNYGTINSNGTFEGTVVNNATGDITGGTFQSTCSVTNTGIIKAGIFTIKVENGGIGEIFGGIFAAGLSKKSGNVAGGVFNGNATITGVRGLHSITWDTAYPNAKITKVNDVSADWKPYVVIDGDALPEVIITADTDIFSLNGKSIVASNCDSEYPDTNDKTTVKFTMPDDKDVVLNGAITCTDLVMEKGWPEASNEGTISCEGTGWSYDHITKTLTLTSNSGTYDFSLANPQDTTNKTPADSAVACAIVIESGAEITGGTFEKKVTNNAGGTISGGTFQDTCSVTNSGTIKKGTFKDACSVTNEGTNATIENGTFKNMCRVINNSTIKNGTFKNKCSVENNNTIENGTFAGSVTNSGTVTGGVFNGNATLINVTGGHNITWDAASSKAKIEKVNGVSANWAPYVVTSNATTKEVTITADTEIFSLNGQPIAESSYGSDKTTVTFTMPDDDVVLNKAITSTDLVMENGWPKDSNGGTIPCKGDGWEYIKNDPTNGDMLLLTGSNQTGGLFDFSTIGDGSAVKCNVFVGKPTAITGGEFNGKVFNNSGILGGTFHGEVDNMGPGTIKDGTFKNSVENKGIVENGTFHDEVKNNGTINDGAFNGKVENNSVINSGTFNSPVDNTTMGRIEDGMFNDAVENNGTIEKGTFHDAVKNNGTINSGTFNGAVENNGTINSGTFNGAVTDNGTISGNITGSGTLNGEPITKTPEPEPEPEPTTYTVTVIGGMIDGKTSVSAKENDTLTVVLDQNDIPDGMTFDLWSISSDKLSGDINVDYRAEAMTFQMPAEDVTIRAQYRSAEIIEDAAPSPLATAATVAVGGAAAGIVVWQGVSLGVDLYLTSALPQGVPVPTDRRALALLLWETAGKPEVALPTLYGDIPTEEIELQKATRWAIQNGLMDAADKKDASFFDPDHYVTKMDVFGAWLRLKKLLGTT